MLELLFAAAALVIDTLRTFFLVVLSILGPVAFAISVWDGFHSTLSQWFCRYIQIYLWLPVSDLFSTILAKIQILMLQNDIEALQSDPNFSIEASNGVYITFLIIGIVGYFTIPTVAGWIISAGGGIGNYGRNLGMAGGLAGSVAGAQPVMRQDVPGNWSREPEAWRSPLPENCSEGEVKPVKSKLLWNLSH